MENDSKIIEKLNQSIDVLEYELDKLIMDNKVKTQQIKKLYKESDLLKKKYKTILTNLSQYIEELESLKKNHVKD